MRFEELLHEARAKAGSDGWDVEIRRGGGAGGSAHEELEDEVRRAGAAAELSGFLDAIAGGRRRRLSALGFGLSIQASVLGLRFLPRIGGSLTCGIAFPSLPMGILPEGALADLCLRLADAAEDSPAGVWDGPALGEDTQDAPVPPHLLGWERTAAGWSGTLSFEKGFWTRGEGPVRHLDEEWRSTRTIPVFAARRSEEAGMDALHGAGLVLAEGGGGAFEILRPSRHLAGFDLAEAVEGASRRSGARSDGGSPPSRPDGRAVVFLDLDGVVFSMRSHLARRSGGVLWSEPDRTAIGLIDRLCSDHGALVVLVSDRRKIHAKDEIWAQLRAGGMRSLAHPDWRTRDLGRGGAGRGEEIEEWLSRHLEVEAWVWLDDDALGLEGQPRVRTDGRDGMLFRHWEEADRLLSEPRGRNAPDAG